MLLLKESDPCSKLSKEMPRFVVHEHHATATRGLG
jgi:hypothetical protein